MGLPPNVPGAYFNEQRGTNSLGFDAVGLPHIAHFADGLGLRHATFSTSPSWGNFLLETVDAEGQCVPAKILFDQRNVLHIAYQAQLSGGTTELGGLRRNPSPCWVPPWTTATIDPSVNSAGAYRRRSIRQDSRISATASFRWQMGHSIPSTFMR